MRTLTWNGGRGVGGCGSSVPVWNCGEGESGRKNSCGNSLSLAECAATAKLENTSLSSGGFQGPLRKVFSLLPGQRVDGTEDRKVFARPPFLRRLIAAFFHKGKGETATTFIVCLLLCVHHVLDFNTVQRYNGWNRGPGAG